MIPSNRSNPQVAHQNALTVDKYITVYVLLAGVAGGLVLAVVVMVCCKVCLRKKKPLTRQHVVFSRGSERQHSRARKYHSLDSAVSMDIETSCGYPDSSPSSRDLKEFDPEELIESGISQSWQHALGDAGTEDFGPDIELKELTKGRAAAKVPSTPESKGIEAHSDSSSPERPPEVTSVVRRRSSVGIQRQASVCLSDEEDQTLGEGAHPPGSVPGQPKPSAPPQREVTKVAAIVHHSCNDRPQPHSWDQASVGSSTSQPIMGVRHPPFIHSHSSPDTGSTATAHDSRHSKMASAISLHGIPADKLARVVDLEEYHYSRQQVWELATQGATLLKERSQSSLDVAEAGEAWTEEEKRIQQAASTEAGLLEESLEQHQLEHLRSLLRRYSPVDEEDTRIWSKVRYNDTGSREDIREEVIEMISGESSDESSSGSSVESAILKEQYRQLWQLRATLEEEEDKLSDAQTEDPPEGAAPMPREAASFESSAEVSCEDPEYECEDSEHLQLPSHELRRHCYKSLLTKRLQKRTPPASGGTESSFDSVESSSTDRTEGATTSFESTTDNTDSTGEGQTNRLQQMKADSGYKSMESNGKAPRLCRKQLQFTLEGDSLDQMMTMESTFEEEIEVPYEESTAESTKGKASMETSKVVSFEGVTVEGETLSPCEPQVHKKKYKSALKKHSTESDIQCVEQPVLPEVTEARGKTSVFQRFFRSGRLRYDPMQHFRDYSIDEKSDALFREFSRPDVPDVEFHRSRSSRLHGHMRFHHRSSEGGSSPHLPSKVLSPQLSIEEESCESGGEEPRQAGDEPAQQKGGDEPGARETQAQIPVICLSQGGEGQ